MSPRFRSFLVALLALPAVASVAHARLGLTLAECIEKYGPTHTILPSTLAESDPQAVRFEQDQLSFIIHFHDGVAWHVAYAQGYLSDQDKHRLLAQNTDLGEWQPRFGERIGNVLLYHNREAKAVACGINIKKLNTLEVMTRACAEAFGRTRIRRLDPTGDQTAPLPVTPPPAAPDR